MLPVSFLPVGRCRLASLRLPPPAALRPVTHAGLLAGTTVRRGGDGQAQLPISHHSLPGAREENKADGRALSVTRCQGGRAAGMSGRRGRRIKPSGARVTVTRRGQSCPGGVASDTTVGAWWPAPRPFSASLRHDKSQHRTRPLRKSL